jgi:ribulose-phosphate 3-epimerase
MTKIAPSILSSDFSILGKEIERIETAGADWAHIDVMDGMFVPNLTIGPSVVGSIRKVTKMPFDVHLMIEDPVRYVEPFAKAGADMLTIHTETSGDIHAALDKIKDMGLKAGITLNPPTPVKDLDQYLDKVDLVLIMTVQAGFGGQSFQENGIPKIEYVRKYADDHNPKLEISVDGGINRETGKRCVDAGATVLAAGSSLFKLDTVEMSEEIALWKKYGPNASG